MIEIDHAILPVADLDEAADSLLSAHGLASIRGGRHAGHGTANRIIPLGANYLELMAVVDRAEAAGSPMGRWVAGNISPDLTPAALCLRTDDITPIAVLLGEEPEAMSRKKPDGSVLAWHLIGLSGMLGPQHLPFFIEWHCEPPEHPGATPIQHRIEPEGITAVTIGSPGPLREILTAVEGVTVAAGSGIIEVVIGTPDGPIILD